MLRQNSALDCQQAAVKNRYKDAPWIIDASYIIYWYCLDEFGALQGQYANKIFWICKHKQKIFSFNIHFILKEQQAFGNSDETQLEELII